MGLRLARNTLRPRGQRLWHRPLRREAPGGPGQQDGGERLPRVAVHGTYGRAGKAADALRDHAGHAGVVGVVDVGVGARRGVGGRREGGGVHELLVRRALGLARRPLLADVQRSLGGEGLREGAAAVALVVVVDVVAEQAACSLWKGGGGR